MHKPVRGIALLNKVTFVPRAKQNSVTFLLYHVLHVRKDAESYRMSPSNTILTFVSQICSEERFNKWETRARKLASADRATNTLYASVLF